MATLQAAITQIQALSAAVSGVRPNAAPDEPPDQISHFPFVACFPESGSYEGGNPAGQMRGLHNIVVELHVARQDVQRGYREAMRFAKSLPNAWLAALGTASLNTISTFGTIRYQFGALDWGVGENATQTMGFRFVIEDVKTQDTIT